MSNDIDFEQFIKLLDGALASDDKNVKQALRKFLFVAAMVMGDDTEPGPFTQMMDTIDALQRRVATLESQNTYTTTTDNTWITGTGISSTGTGTAFPPATTAGGTSGSITAISPSTTGGSITSTGCTTYTNPTSNIIAFPNANTTGSTWNVFGNATNTTTTTLWYDDISDPKTGTSIKAEIKEGLEKLAKSA